jgi:hypothetical protein
MDITFYQLALAKTNAAESAHSLCSSIALTQSAHTVSISVWNAPVQLTVLDAKQAICSTRVFAMLHVPLGKNLWEATASNFSVITVVR